MKGLEIIVATGVFAVALGCGGSGSNGGTGGGGGDPSGGSDPMDGSWNLVSETCDGTPVSVTGINVSVIMTVQGSSGSWDTTIVDPGGDTCAMSIPMTLFYPAVGSVTWTYGALTSTPATCLSNSGATNVSGMLHAGTYVVEGNQLTLTEETAPEDDLGCPGGRAVLTFRKPN